jgi:hypothetical protein
VKFFSQNRFTSAFSLLFATCPNLAVTAAVRPLKRKKSGKTSPAAEVRLITVPGNRKTCAVRSSLLEAVHTR